MDRLDKSTDSNPNPFSPLTHSLISNSSSSFNNSPSSKNFRFSTKCATVDNPDCNHQDRFGSSSVPIYQSSTFKGLNNPQYDYSRSGNPSRTFLQHHVAKISSAKHAFAVNSGMAALDVILRTLKPGDQIIAGNDLYGGSNRLLTYIKQHNGILTHHIDTTDLDCLEPFLIKDSKVRMVLLESPTNPLLQIVDIQEIIQRVKAIIPEAVFVVDNTMMSPYLMKPLEFGADIVYDSGTKYLSGHHDLMAGLIICNSDSIADQLAFIINSIGNGLAPFECFLLTRGIKTLSLRLDRQQASAIRIAHYLDQLAFTVHFPGLPNHKGKAIHDRLAKGPGAVLSFETGNKQLSERIVNSTRLWGISVSFGCVNSLISMPCLMSHASIDPAIRAARKLPEDLIRLCVGIEDPEDLIEDLQAALIEAGAIRIRDETTADSGLERVKNDEDELETYLNGDEIVSLTNQIQKSLNTNHLAAASSLLVSAPGKIILFGEHAVVYGKRAIAAAVNLRCYCLVESEVSSNQSSVTLDLPDSGWKASWSLDELPWDKLDQNNHDSHLNVDPDLSKATLTKAAEKATNSSLIQAAHAFLYLFVKLAKKSNRRSQVFTVRSTLPIGAGLGSSASYSVCLASGLLYSHEHVTIAQEGKKVEKAEVDEINRWAFLGEKILHGNPSGVDNTVSSFGGAICFRKETNDRTGPCYSKESKPMEQIVGFKQIRILITDTRVPRDTKSLVAGVLQRKKEEPDYIQTLLNEIEAITSEAKELIQNLNQSGHPDPQHSTRRNEIIDRLGSLMESNHCKLSALGVSHEQLELVKRITSACAEGEEGLKTKLTGAGGGGCAISLVPDEFKEERLTKIVGELEALKMKTYETQVGVAGVGVLALSSSSSAIKQAYLEPLGAQLAASLDRAVKSSHSPLAWHFA